jgi:hypothetical protein
MRRLPAVVLAALTVLGTLAAVTSIPGSLPVLADAGLETRTPLPRPGPATEEGSAPEMLWIRWFGSSGYTNALALATGGSTVYVVGTTWGALSEEGGPGGGDAFLRQYDANGNVRWTQQFGTSGGDYAYAADYESGVYVAGHTDPSGTGANFEIFLVRYEEDGTHAWTRQFGTSEWEFCFAVTADETGVYVAGHTRGAFTGETNAGGYDAFVQKYDAGGTWLWTRQFGTSSDDTALTLAADVSGLYVAGVTGSVLPGEPTAGDGGAFLRKYDADGAVVWTRQFGGSASAVAADASGIYVVGFTGGAFPGEISAGGDDAFLRKYDADGAVVWTRQFGSSEADAANAVAVDASGVYVAGMTGGEFPGETLAGNTDAFLRNYDLSGSVLWTAQFGSSESDAAFAVAVDTSGVYVAGTALQTMPGSIGAFLAAFPVPAASSVPHLVFGLLAGGAILVGAVVAAVSLLRRRRKRGGAKPPAGASPPVQ